MRLLGCFLPLLSTTALAFQFSVSGSPTSCEKLTVTWTGGTAPFSLQLIPVFGVPRNVQIPGNAQGSFSVDQLPFPADQEFVIAMSDSTGAGTGGASNVLKAAKSSSSCDTNSPSVAFSFQLNSQLQQCKPFTFAAFDDAIQPVQILGIVPGGQVTAVNPPNGAKSFDWTANVKQGTNMMFMMTDAQGRQGGSSKLQQVGNSDDQACLKTDTPSSTSPSTPSTSANGGQTHTTTPSASSTATAAPSSSGSSSKPVGAIVGGVVGTLVALGVSAALIMLYLRRRRAKNQWVGSTPLSDSPFPSMFQGHPRSTTAAYGGQSNSRMPAADPFSDPPISQTTAPGYYPPSSSSSRVPPPPSPYKAPSPVSPYNGPAPAAPVSPFNTRAAAPPPVSPFNGPAYGRPAPSSLAASAASSDRSAMSSERSAISSQRKALEASSPAKKQSRLVLHTDSDDVEELPPQYSDRRVSAMSTSLAYAQDTYTDDAHSDTR